MSVSSEAAHEPGAQESGQETQTCRWTKPPEWRGRAKEKIQGKGRSLSTL